VVIPWRGFTFYLRAERASLFWHASGCPPRANLQEKSFLIFCEKVVDLERFSVIIGA
jgi:hypothetical protein